MNIPTMLTHMARILSYRNIIITLFFTGSIHYIRLLLRKDIERNHLLGFCLYIALLCTSYYANLPSLRFVLLICAPAIVMFFIVLHVETIFQSSQLSKIKELNALIDELIQCAQTALKKRKETIIIVEGNDTLKDLIHAPYFIYAEFKQDVFEILLEKQAPGTDYLIWINHHGKIVSINSDWKTPLNDERISEEIEHMYAWKQHALYVSRKTDALILKINPFSQTFDVVSQGHIVVGLNMEALISNLKQQPFHASKKVTTIDLHQASQKSIYSKLHRET